MFRPALICLALFACSAPPEPTPLPVEERLPLPVPLHSFRPVIGMFGEPEGVEKYVSCTGIPIGGGLALTVKHYDGPKVAEHPTLDVALVEIGDYPNVLDKAPVRLSDPRLGERLFCLGFPLNGPLMLTCGFASAKVGRATFLIAHGNSGSPVFDGQGRLVGVASAVEVVGAGPFGLPVWHLAHYVPVSRVWPWVEDIRRSRLLHPKSALAKPG